MDFQFVLPQRKEDLLNPIDGQYKVEKLDFKTAWKSLSVFKKSVLESGCSSVLNHFDVLFSILYEAQDVSCEQLKEVWDSVLYLILQDLRIFAQEGIKNEDPERRIYYLNVVLMNIYLFSLFLETYEQKTSSDGLIVDRKSKIGKGKKKDSKFYSTWDWTEAKKLAFYLINGVLLENINCLWEPPLAEEKFVNLLAKSCYKVFENPEIIQAKCKPLKDSVSQVLAVLVHMYNHAFSFIPQSVQLMKDFEHIAQPFAASVLAMVVDYSCVSILPKMLRELTEAARDEEQGLGKSAAAFISLISESKPQVFLPNVKILAKSLAFEPYVLRNAVLMSFCEVLLKSFSTEGMSSQDKRTRDLLLKYLHNHLRDQNSYVRSKCLQLWSRLASAHGIPVDFFMPVLRTAKARLTDSSSFVVKSAIQFFITVLKDNIYAGKFNVSELRNQLKSAQETMKSFENKQLPSSAELWDLLVPDLAIQLNLIFEQGADKVRGELPPPEEPPVPISDTLTIIYQLLMTKNFYEAYELLKVCEVQYPDAQEIRCNMDRSDEIEYYIATLKKIFFHCKSNYNPHSAELEQQRLIVSYLEDTIAFAHLISEVSKEVERLLFASSTIEASEAIEFFSVAFQFSAGDSRRVVRQMVLLIWSKVAGVREAVSSAYRTLYLDSSQPAPRGKAMQAASRLIRLLREMNYEQKTALKELIHIWFKENCLNKEFIQVLWEIYSKKLPQFNETDCVGALMLLDMIAEKNPPLASLNLQVLISNGLLRSNDLLMIEYTCEMISKLSEHKNDDRQFLRLCPENELFQIVSEIVVEKFSEAPLKGFLPMALAVVKMIYKVCWNPLQVSDNLLEELYDKMKKNSENLPSKDGDGNDDSHLYDEKLLIPLLTIFGESIFRKWQYFDKDVINALKKQTNAPSKANETAGSLEEELEAENQEAANDALLNSVNLICDECLDLEGSLDAHLKKLVVKLSFGRVVSTPLQTAAVAALTKLMMISNSFCDSHIQILVTAMEKAPGETVRGNAVLGFGDLVMRWPNILDPWTSHLYARLKDSSWMVRREAVTVLSHLITREMVKVRGQIAELCLCLEDPQPLIASAVRLLLRTLSEKGNTLYNVIPDIISRLSNPQREDPLPLPAFQRIIKFVLKLIGKERQNDLLVEKLCSRLSEAETQTQWLQFSFCLTQLSYSERSLKRLTDSLHGLNERLLHPEVYSALQGIYTSASKAHFTKPQIKELANEGLAKLEELVTMKDQREENGSRSETKRRSQESAEGEESKSEDDLVEPSVRTRGRGRAARNEANQEPQMRRTGGRRVAARKGASWESGEEMDSKSEDEQPVRTRVKERPGKADEEEVKDRMRNRGRGKTVKRKTFDSSEEESDDNNVESDDDLLGPGVRRKPRNGLKQKRSSDEASDGGTMEDDGTATESSEEDAAAQGRRTGRSRTAARTPAPASQRKPQRAAPRPNQRKK